MNKLFYYEHIGHMQISVLTLELYDVILKLSQNNIGKPIKVREIVDIIKNRGFSTKVIVNEIERFFYGFECIETYDNSIKYLSLTQMGLDYINEIMKVVKLQESGVAFIVKNSRKKNSVNVIVQESTFFNPQIYSLLKQKKFRDGGARDFLKCLPINDFSSLLRNIVPNLRETFDNNYASIDECKKLVENNGKYWSSVSSKYSWIYFKQKYSINFSEVEWKQYELIIDYAKRPVEWGGNASDISHDWMIDKKINVTSFLNTGIIRKLYSNGKFLNKYRLTAPGYLIFERKNRGYLLECILRREKSDNLILEICNASDREEYYLYGDCHKHFDRLVNASYDNVFKYLNNQLLLYKNRGALINEL